MRVCRKEGKNNPDLWVQVLTFLVKNASLGDNHQSSPVEDGSLPSPVEGNGVGGDGLSSDDEGGGGGEGRWDDVREILALIERDQVLPPMRVRQRKQGVKLFCCC